MLTRRLLIMIVLLILGVFATLVARAEYKDMSEGSDVWAAIATTGGWFAIFMAGWVGGGMDDE